MRAAKSVTVAMSLIGISIAALPPMTAAAATATTTPIPAGSTWRLHDRGVDLGTTWRGTTYDDSSWSQGSAQIGYGDGDERRTVSGNRSTYYFRRTFTVDNPSAVTALSMRAVIDDGAVVHLNGTPVWRTNIAANPRYSTLATSYVAGPAEKVWKSAALPAGSLRQGTNVLAVEIHNDALSSSDISFDLELNQTTTTTAAAPATPTGVTGTATSDSAVALSWAAVPGATSYTVYRGTAATGTVSTPRFDDTGLSPSTTYSYSVEARNATGASAKSTAVSVRTNNEANKIMCRIDNPALREMSGLASSVLHPGILWTHNDSGDSARIFAIDSTTCAIRATVTLSGATALDYEAISIGRDAAGKPEIWVGDIGDNAWARPNVKLYRFPEPATLTNQAVTVKPVTVTWSEGARDAESLIAEPVANGRIFLVSKEATGGVYQLRGDFRNTGTATTGTRLISTRAYATDAAVSPDQSKTIVRSGNYGTLLTGLPGTAPRSINCPAQAQGEAITFSQDGRYVFIVSEGASDLIRIPIASL